MTTPRFFSPLRAAGRRTGAGSARRWARALLLLALSAGAAGAAEPPRRIVSFNLCADQLVVALADPDQIAGLSPYAANRWLSVVADKARPFPRLDWQAESTLAVAPDLVFTGPNDRSATRRMLAALGMRLAEVELVTDIAAARAQIRQVAALVGHAPRGEDLVAALDRAERRLAAVARPAATALIVERGGYAAGPHSLPAAILAAAGLRPPPGGPSGYGGYMSLEHLITLRPDILVIKDPPQRAQDQGALFFTHPALDKLYPPDRRIALPSRYTLCGGPALVAALDYVADMLTRGGGEDHRRPAVP